MIRRHRRHHAIRRHRRHAVLRHRHHAAAPLLTLALPRDE